MKIETFLVVLTAVIISAVGCTSSDEIEPQDQESGCIKFSSSAIESRVTEELTWCNSDKIGIFTDGFNEFTSGGFDYENVGYLATPNSDNANYATFSVDESAGESAIVYPNVVANSSNSVTFHAYYPYHAEASKEANIPVSISPQYGDIGAVDFLFASTVATGFGVGDGSTNSSSIDFSFSHKLSKIVITVEVNQNIISLENMSATLSNIYTKAYYRYDSGEFVSGTLCDDDNNLTATSNIEITATPVEGYNFEKATVTAILHPNSCTDQTHITITTEDNRSFCALFNQTLNIGFVHYFTLSIGEDYVGFTSHSNIEAWEEDATDSYDDPSELLSGEVK